MIIFSRSLLKRVNSLWRDCWLSEFRNCERKCRASLIESKVTFFLATSIFLETKRFSRFMSGEYGCCGILPIELSRRWFWRSSVTIRWTVDQESSVTSLMRSIDMRGSSVSNAAISSFYSSVLEVRLRPDPVFLLLSLLTFCWYSLTSCCTRRSFTTFSHPMRYRESVNFTCFGIISDHRLYRKS